MGSGEGPGGGVGDGSGVAGGGDGERIGRGVGGVEAVSPEGDGSGVVASCFPGVERSQAGKAANIRRPSSDKAIRIMSNQALGFANNARPATMIPAIVNAAMRPVG